VYVCVCVSLPFVMREASSKRGRGAHVCLFDWGVVCMYVCTYVCVFVTQKASSNKVEVQVYVCVCVGCSVCFLVCSCLCMSVRLSNVRDIV
jgi:hypothetical protein